MPVPVIHKNSVAGSALITLGRPTRLTVSITSG
jgi:hypothetical protein